MAESPIRTLLRRPSSKEDYLALQEDVWAYLKDSRPGLEYRIREALHFLGGDQWIRYAGDGHFDRHTLEDWIPTPVTNFLVEHYDYLRQVYTGGDPYPAVDPATRDQADVDAARAAERSTRSEFERLGSKALISDAAGWLVMSGNTVLTSSWNAKSGNTLRKPRMKLLSRPIPIDSAKCQVCGHEEDPRASSERCVNCNGPMVMGKSNERDELGNEVRESYEEQEHDERGPVYDRISVGNLEEQVVSLLNWYPQPCRSMDRCRFVLETDPVDIDWLKDTFGAKEGDVPPDHLEYDKFNTQASFADMQISGGKGKDRDRAMLRILRHIPDHRFPKGLMTIGVRGKILYCGDLDNTLGDLPYTHIVYRRLPGIFWGASPIADVLPQQKRINAIDSHIVLNRKQMANGQWLVPEGAGMSHVSGQSGLMIRWNPHSTGGFKPERQPGVPVSQQVIQERQSTIQDMQHVDGLQDIVSGNLPAGASGLETGAAVEFLYEQAYKRFKGALDNWREGLGHHWKRNLLIISENWEEERLVRVLGDNSELDAHYYQGSDFHGAQDMVVRVALGAQTSKVAHKQQVMDAAKVGLLGDVRQPEVRGRILEALEIEGFDSEYVRDAKKARRALQAIREGAEPPPLLPQIDNHSIQFSIFRDFILTSDFEAEAPEVQQAIVQWAQQHQQIMQEQQAQVMQAAQAAKGTGEGVSQAISDSGALGAQVQTQAVGG